MPRGIGVRLAAGAGWAVMEAPAEQAGSVSALYRVLASVFVLAQGDGVCGWISGYRHWTCALRGLDGCWTADTPTPALLRPVGPSGATLPQGEGWARAGGLAQRARF